MDYLLLVLSGARAGTLWQCGSVRKGKDLARRQGILFKETLAVEKRRNFRAPLRIPLADPLAVPCQAVPA